MSIPESNNNPPLRSPAKFALSFLIHPKDGFQKIASQPRGSWFTPMLIVSLAAIFCLLAIGWLKQQAAMTGIPSLPPDFDYFTPEQQAQYLQSAQATQGITFVYVLPIIGSLFGIWLGWLIVGGTLHFVTTLLGGRGETGISMNIVAWASLPLAVRNIVRLIYLVISHKLIESPGLSGFISTTDSNWSLVLISILGMIDIYLIWYVILLVIGVRATTGLSARKSVGSVIIALLFIFGLQVAAQFLISKIGNLSITRPFFF
jgi:hypothetical protein